jgi:synaptotagmin-like protein
LAVQEDHESSSVSPEAAHVSLSGSLSADHDNQPSLSDSLTADRLSSTADHQLAPDSPAITSKRVSNTKKSPVLVIAPNENIEEDVDGAFAAYSPSSPVDSEPKQLNALRSRSQLSSKSIGSQESILSTYSMVGHTGDITVTGDISFQIVYNTQYRVLEVFIKECRNLAAVNSRKKLSNPYVKVYLLPDKSKSGKRKTKVARNTLNPVFEQTLQFDVSKSNISTITVWIAVWHNDRFGRNVFLGDLVVPLDGYQFGSQPDWFKLQQQGRELWKSELSLVHKAELEFSLQVQKVLLSLVERRKHQRREQKENFTLSSSRHLISCH